MLSLNKRVAAFVALGKLLDANSDWTNNTLKPILSNVFASNNWFTHNSVLKATTSLCKMLSENNIVEWLSNYKISAGQEPKRVGIIMAGNIPLVGFHDMLCVIISGNIAVIKTSKDDNILPRLIAKALIDIEPAIINYIEFVDAKLQNFNAVIATGSNNSARYFKHYFDKYPHIIRKNRTSIAVLTGSENNGELAKLGNDIFNYFGLGCRNVSKVFVPHNYDFAKLFEALFSFGEVANHNKYANNYDYNRAIYLMNGEKFLDNNFLIIKESNDLKSPLAVLYFEYYDNNNSLTQNIHSINNNLQCIVSNNFEIDKVIAFGKSQEPMLWDYSDGIDTMSFLLGLN